MERHQNQLDLWLVGESKHAIGCTLTCLQAGKLESIDKLFLVTKREFKRFYESDFEHCPMKR